MGRAISKTLAIVVGVVILIAVVAAVLIYMTSQPAPTTTPVTTPTPTPTTPVEYKLRFGDVEVSVTREVYEIAQKAKNRQIDVTITFWVSMMPFEEDVIRSVIANFTVEYPGIKVNLVHQDSMRDVYQAQVAIGRGPDLLTWAHDWTGGFAEASMIVPLDQYLTNDILNQYVSSALRAASYNNKIWGLPWAAETVALVCNNALVSKIPESFDELKNIMQQYYNPDADKYGISYQVDPYFVSAWPHGFGGYYFDDTTKKPGVNLTETVNGIKFFYENIYVYLYKGDLGHDAQLNLFLTGKTPCIVTGPWDIKAIRDAGINFTITPLPKISETIIPKPYSGVKLIWLNPNSQNKEAAVLFALWFTLNNKVIQKLAEEAGFVPVLKTVLEWEGLSRLPVVYGYAKAVENSIPMPSSPEMNYVWGPVSDALTAINQGVSTIEEALNYAQEQILQKLSG
ncbi:MAG: extracellular solute-binding protein [Zestosphaera sp.]